MIIRYQTRDLARKAKVRAKLRKTSARPRLSVFRSNKYIYAQVIDDETGKTLAAASEKDLDGKKTKKKKKETKLNKARAVGEILARKLLKKKIKKVYFDRGSYKYHGRVKALADGARKAGLEF